MNYYLKVEILRSYDPRNAGDTSGSECEIREIEFYNGNGKIAINKLSIVNNSSQYGSGWTIDRIIDGYNTNATQSCDFYNSTYPVYVIIKCTDMWNKIMVYNDDQGGYGAKEIEFYYLDSTTDPLRTDSDWKKFSSHLIENNTQYPSGLSTQTEIMSRQKFLIQDGDRIKRILTDHTINDISSTPFTIDIFNNYGMNDLTYINSSEISNLNNNKFKIAMYKK